MKLLLIPIALAALFGCGGGKNPDKEIRALNPGGQKIGARDVAIIDGANTLAFKDGAAEGTGTLRFADAAEKPESASNYDLTFEIAEGGSLTLVVNADRALAGGVELQLTRPAGGAVLQVLALVGEDKLALDDSFKGIDAATALRLSFDLHNDHGDSAHLIAWDETAGRELLEDMLQGKGNGMNWGLRLRNARVLVAERREAKEKDR